MTKPGFQTDLRQVTTWLPIPWLVFLTLAVSSTPLGAGVVLRVETKHLNPAVERVGLTRIEGQRLRIDPEVKGDGAPAQPTVVFDGTEGVMITIDHSSKSFARIEPEALARLASRIQAQGEAERARMESLLADLPEEQRLRAEELLRQRQGPELETGGAPEGLEIRATEIFEEIEGQRCRRLDVYRNDRRLREIWITEWANVDLHPDTFSVFGDLSAYYDRLFANLAPAMAEARAQNPFEVFDLLDGFPVLIKRFEDGALAEEIRVSVVERRALEDDLFVPPEGYQGEDVDPERLEARAGKIGRGH